MFWISTKNDNAHNCGVEMENHHENDSIPIEKKINNNNTIGKGQTMQNGIYFFREWDKKKQRTYAKLLISFIKHAVLLNKNNIIKQTLLHIIRINNLNEFSSCHRLQLIAVCGIKIDCKSYIQAQRSFLRELKHKK